jgi:hypothetical protein
MTQMIPIKSIKQSSELQPRAKMDTAIIDEYTEAMKRGDAFPAVTVFDVEGTYYLVDGYHRFMAAQGAKIGKILADVKAGTMRDAILYSAGVNAKHGLNRTNEDKNRAVTILLRDAEWVLWSDPEVAAACHVSVDLVAKIRKAIIPKTDRCMTERKVKRGGKVYKMDTSKIGKKLLTQPAKDHPNHGQYVAQPGTLPITDDPPQPSLAEQQATKGEQELATAEEAPEQDQLAGTSKEIAGWSIETCRSGTCPDGQNHRIKGSKEANLGDKCALSGGFIRDQKSCHFLEGQKRAESEGFVRASNGSPSFITGSTGDVPHIDRSRNPQELTIAFSDKQWAVLKQIVRENLADGLEGAVLYLVDEAGERTGG